jgi:hypothetical protein
MRDINLFVDFTEILPVNRRWNNAQIQIGIPVFEPIGTAIPFW